MWSEVGVGTELELRFPANIVYDLPVAILVVTAAGLDAPARVGDAP